MRMLHYTGDAVLVADDVCLALLRYAQSLAEAQRSDLVTVPVIADDGSTTTADFLLGPASQLYSTSAPHRPHQADNPDAVSDLDRRTRRLHPVAIIEHFDLGDAAYTSSADDWWADANT